MSKKVLDQDTSQKAPEQEMLMAQLLFDELPEIASPEALKAALEVNLGAVENISDKPDMPMFSCTNFVGEFKGGDKVPVLANIMAPIEFKTEIDELNRSQFWDVQNGTEIIDGTKYCVNVFAMLSGALHYKQQAELLLAQVDAALKCYPTCKAIYVLSSGKLTTPEQFEECKQYDLPGRFLRLAVNARFFTINGTDDMIVDTLGFYAFGAADVQVHFHGIDPNYVVNYVYNIASYQFGADFPIKSGDTVDSIGKDGSMQWEPQWHAQYENSLIQPIRTVLDVNCGQYAAGNRNG
ncbi:MAG: DUF4261 domain-containing protein [Oscillospiraceae bacterium]|nr:DUF4261 domain-containing protein [Oscillospiraceae bacterium]